MVVYTQLLVWYVVRLCRASAVHHLAVTTVMRSFVHKVQRAITKDMALIYIVHQQLSPLIAQHTGEFAHQGCTARIIRMRLPWTLSNAVLLIR